MPLVSFWNGTFETIAPLLTRTQSSWRATFDEVRGIRLQVYIARGGRDALSMSVSGHRPAPRRKRFSNPLFLPQLSGVIDASDSRLPAGREPAHCLWLTRQEEYGP